jgi:hypothetical protein
MVSDKKEPSVDKANELQNEPEKVKTITRRNAIKRISAMLTVGTLGGAVIRDLPVFEQGPGKADNAESGAPEDAKLAYLSISRNKYSKYSSYQRYSSVYMSTKRVDGYWSYSKYASRYASYNSRYRSMR